MDARARCGLVRGRVVRDGARVCAPAPPSRVARLRLGLAPGNYPALRRGEDSGGLGRPGLAAWIAPGGGVLRGRPPRPRQGGVPRPRAVPDHGERGVREGGLLGGVGRLPQLLALRGPRAAGRMPHPPLPPPMLREFSVLLGPASTSPRWSRCQQSRHSGPSPMWSVTPPTPALPPIPSPH